MLRTRWRKVILDLWGNKVRTLLVVLAITVGVFAVGFISSAQAILLRELSADYENMQAASSTLYTDPFDQKFVDALAEMPDVGAIEGRRGLGVRFQTPEGEWRNLSLTTIPDGQQLEVDRIWPQSGSWPPPRQSVIIERLSLDYLGLAVGEPLLIELPDGTQKQLEVAGTAFDNAVPSAEITGRAFGYISLSTLERLGVGGQFTELRFRVANNAESLPHIEAVTETLRDRVEKSGREVYAVRTATPGEHWAEDIIATLVLLFFVFGGIILFLSSFLVVNTISALITQQTQQIGVMKLIGARRHQIVLMYMVMVGGYCLLALGIGIPLGIRFGRIAVGMATELLNVTVDDSSVPFSVIAIQVAVGLLIPLGAALWPVLKGVGVTTQSALSSVGLDAGSFGEGGIDRLMARIQRRLQVQRPLVIAFRNTLRRKGRMLLTLLILTMGTALFISVLTVRTSVEATFDNFLRYHQYDVGLRFNRAYRSPELARIVEELPQVTAWEGWLRSGTRYVRPDGSESQGVTLIGLPPETRMIDPAPINGRWLLPADQYGVVINSFFQSEEPHLRVGDEMLLRVNEEDVPFTIVGVVPAAADGDTKFYIPYTTFAYLTRQTGQANSLQLLTRTHDSLSQKAVEGQLTTLFNDRGMQVTGSSTQTGERVDLEQRFRIVILFLIVMAVLLATVGGLGLATTMSINILERIREIGVLRAIGASNMAVRRIVVTEGVLIGLASWLLGGLLALPLSVVMSQQVGMALLRVPLDYRFSLLALGIWLFAVLVLAALASLGPAQNASRLTIREVLAYE